MILIVTVMLMEVLFNFFFVGFVKFLGPYYMLLITKRRLIGAICGHSVYAVSKTEMIPLPNSNVQCSITDSRNENRSIVHFVYKCIMSRKLSVFSDISGVLENLLFSVFCGNYSFLCDSMCSFNLLQTSNWITVHVSV